jgi:dTMP kinase
MHGKLIVLEGLDGSGKTTQTELLEQSLRDAGCPHRWLKFPCYDQPFSAPVRMYLNGEFGANPGDVNAYAASSFFAVDRYASFRKFWHEDYENGTVILTDRYMASNLIYQMPKLPRAEWDGFFAWLRDFEFVKLGIPSPDLTIYLDMPQEASQSLLDKRYRENGGSRDIHESSTSYLAACRESAAYAAHRLGWHVVSCAENGMPRSVETIHKDVAAIVREAFGPLAADLR